MRVRDDLADDVELALELVLVLDRLGPADEDLPVHRLHGLDHLGQARVVDRHRAPAQELQAFLADDALHTRSHCARSRSSFGMKIWPTAYSPGLRQLDARLCALFGEERVRDLDQDAGAVAHQRVGADGAAMLEVLEDLERVLDDLVRLARP